MRCAVATHDTIQFLFSIRVRSGIAILTCLTRNPVIVRLGIYSAAQRKRDDRNPSPGVPSSLAKTPLLGPRWRFTWRPTSVGGTYAVSCKRYAGAYAPPLPESGFILPNPAPSLPDTVPVYQCILYIPPGRGSPWWWWELPPIISTPTARYLDLISLRYYLSDLVSTPWGSPASVICLMY